MVGNGKDGTVRLARKLVLQGRSDGLVIDATATGIDTAGQQLDDTSCGTWFKDNWQAFNVVKDKVMMDDNPVAVFNEQ